jgi:hypothetical protein
MKIHSWVSRKKYLHNKAAYGYERFCVPVPKRFQSFVKPFAGREVNINIIPHKDGFTMQVRLSSRPKTSKDMKNDDKKASRTP